MALTALCHSAAAVSRPLLPTPTETRLVKTRVAFWQRHLQQKQGGKKTDVGNVPRLSRIAAATIRAGAVGAGAVGVAAEGGVAVAVVESLPAVFVTTEVFWL